MRKKIFVVLIAAIVLSGIAIADQSLNYDADTNTATFSDSQASWVGHNFVCRNSVGCCQEIDYDNDLFLFNNMDMGIKTENHDLFKNFDIYYKKKITEKVMVPEVTIGKCLSYTCSDSGANESCRNIEYDCVKENKFVKQNREREEWILADDSIYSEDELYKYYYLNNIETDGLKICTSYSPGLEVKYWVIAKPNLMTHGMAKSLGYYAEFDPYLNASSAIWKYINLTESNGVTRNWEIVNTRTQDYCVNATGDFCRSDRHDIEFYHSNLTIFSRDTMLNSTWKLWSTTVANAKKNSDNYANLTISFNNSLLNKPDSEFILWYDDGYNFTNGFNCKNMYHQVNHSSGGWCSYRSNGYLHLEGHGNANNYINLNISSLGNWDLDKNGSIGFIWNVSAVNKTSTSIFYIGKGATSDWNPGYPGYAIFKFKANNTYIGYRFKDENPSTAIYSTNVTASGEHVIRMDWNGTDYRIYIDGGFQFNVSSTDTISSFAEYGAETNISIRKMYAVNWTAAQNGQAKQDLINIYNLGIAYGSGAPPPDIQMDSAPQNGYITTNDITTFQCNATMNNPGLLFLYNTSINIWMHSSYWAPTWDNWLFQETKNIAGNKETFNSTQYVINFDVPHIGDEINATWYCEAWADDKKMNGKSANKSFVFDSMAPRISNALYLTNASTNGTGANVTISYNISDSFPNDCWYNSSENATPTYFTCNTTVSYVFKSEGNITVWYFANDTAGNQRQNSTEFFIVHYSYRITENKEILNEGDSDTITIYLNTTPGYPIPTATTAQLIWNNTNYFSGTKTNPSSNQLVFSNTFLVPTGSGNSSGILQQYYWNLNWTGLANESTDITQENQTVYSVSILECNDPVSEIMILNYTLKYEDNLSIIRNQSTLNTTMEIEASLASKFNSSLVWNTNFSTKNNYTLQVCVPKYVLNGSNISYSLYSLVRYFADNYETEYHYIENFNQTNKSNPKNIDLYDLSKDQSTSFKVSYENSDYIRVPEAIIEVWRKYVDKGGARSVEHSKTDENGEAVSHLVEEEVIYRFYVRKSGELLYISPEYTVICQTLPCTVELRQNKSIIGFDDFYHEDDLTWLLETNWTSRKVSFTYATPDGSPADINITIKKADVFFNNTIYSYRETGLSGGSISYTLPQSVGNDTYYIEVTKEGNYLTGNYFTISPDLSDLFGTAGVFMSGLLVLTLALIGISSGPAAIILTLVGLIVASAMSIFVTGWAVLVYVFCAGVMLIIKMARRGR